MKTRNLLRAGVGLCAVLNTAGAQEQRINFNIPAQPVAGALDALAAQSELQMLFNRQALQNSRTRGVKGSYTPREAIQKLLAGTGLVYTFTADDAVAVKPAPKQLNKAEPTTLAPMTVSAEREYDDTDPFNPTMSSPTPPPAPGPTPRSWKRR